MAIPLFTQLLKAFLAKGKEYVLPNIPSKQLQAGLMTIESSAASGMLRVPQYWAIYVHEGRGPALAAPGGLLIWYRDPSKDPRYPGGIYPTRKSQVRHLTLDQVKAARKLNQPIINRYRRRTGIRNLTAHDYRAMNLPVIFAKISPEGGGSVPRMRAFFSNAIGGGMYGFKKAANNTGKVIVSNYITQRLKSEGLLNMTVTKTIRI